jgi:hypothetical protein
MDGTILGQGFFTQPATAVNQTIMIPSGVDSLEIWNFTQASGTATHGFHFYWQLGMGTQGIVEISGGAHAVTANVTVAGAFVLYDPSQQLIPILNNGSTGVTGFTAANPAVVTVGSTTGMAAGNIVTFSSLNNQPQYNGIPFSVGYGTLTGTTFSVDYLNSTGSTPSTTGNFSVIPYQPLFYPRRRIITNITAAANAVITLSVDHGYTVGQEVRFSLNGGTAVWGSYFAMDGQSATITAVDTATGVGHNTITVNFNTTGFGTFAFPPAGDVPFTPAEVIPFGDNTAVALAQVPPLSSLEDATFNTGFLGMTLAAGALLPAGVAADVVYWVARKSTYGGQ